VSGKAGEGHLIHSRPTTQVRRQGENGIAVSYDVEWVKGMGRGLASNIAHLLAQRAEQGWRVQSVNPCQAGDMWGAIVVLERAPTAPAAKGRGQRRRHALSHGVSHADR
jgi:hypothetical protein